MTKYFYLLGAVWLGGTLGYLGYTAFTWEFWAIIIPANIFYIGSTHNVDKKGN